MKRITLAGLLVLLLTSCGNYKYYQPTTNQALFHGPWEVQGVAEAGTSGLGVKGALSLPYNIGMIGMYKGGALRYRASEGEIGLGYYTHADPSGIFALGGIGFGRNFEYTDSTYTNVDFEGRFLRPFVQINMGIDGGEIGSVVRGDAIVSLKMQRFYYLGEYLDGSGDQIRSSYTILEPGFIYGIGVKSFRINLSLGFPFRPNLEALPARHNARTFPVYMGFGLRFVFNRPEG